MLHTKMAKLKWFRVVRGGLAFERRRPPRAGARLQAYRRKSLSKNKNENRKMKKRGIAKRSRSKKFLGESLRGDNFQNVPFHPIKLVTTWSSLLILPLLFSQEPSFLSVEDAVGQIVEKVTQCGRLDFVGDLARFLVIFIDQLFGLSVDSRFAIERGDFGQRF